MIAASTATVVMNSVVPSTARARRARQQVAGPHAHGARRPAALPAGVLVPLVGAVKRITATPASADRAEGDRQAADPLVEEERGERHDDDRHQAADELRVGDARLGDGDEEQREVGGEEHRARARPGGRPAPRGDHPADAGRPSRWPRRRRAASAAVARPGAPISLTMVEPSDSPNCARQHRGQADRRPSAAAIAPRPAGAVVTPRRRGGCPVRGRSGGPRARPRGRGPPPRRWPTRSSCIVRQWSNSTLAATSSSSGPRCSVRMWISVSTWS